MRIKIEATTKNENAVITNIKLDGKDIMWEKSRRTWYYEGKIDFLAEDFELEKTDGKYTVDVIDAESGALVKDFKITSMILFDSNSANKSVQRITDALVNA